MISNSWQEKMVNFVLRQKSTLLYSIGFLGLLGIIFFSDIAAAVTIEEQLDRVGVLTNGKVKVIGVTVSTLVGFFGAIVKGNIKIAIIILLTGIALAMMLAWIASGMIV